MWELLAAVIGIRMQGVHCLRDPTAVIAAISLLWRHYRRPVPLMQRADELRPDEVIENNIDRVHSGPPQ